MRMRNLAWANDFLKKQAVVVKEPQCMVGIWANSLQKEKLHVEIGTGKGEYWINMAVLYPHIAWIGIEKNKNVAALAVRKYTQREQPLENVLFINGDAQELATWFNKAEIDVIHLNFSDPWPKKRAHKKRLTNPTFLKQYAYILKEDGEIHMKTDNSSLFEYSILEFQKEGWLVHDVSVDFRRTQHAEDAISEYERRFMSQNQPIYRAIWKKH